MKIKDNLIEKIRAKVEHLVGIRDKKNDYKLEPNSNDSLEIIDSIPYENEIKSEDDFFIFDEDQLVDFGSLFTNDGTIDEIFGE